MDLSAAVEVKVRYLTEDEISSTFALEIVDVVEQEKIESSETLGTNEGITTSKEDEAFEQKTNKTNSETKTEASAIALADSERKELETYRRKDKEALIESFREDLKKEFIDGLITEIDSNNLEDLDTKLSKEFTKMMKSNRVENTNNVLIYKTTIDSEHIESDAEIAKRMVDTYK
ncbi:hypothetical protein DRO61_11985 [Candidatus Bathyarchaeota archaeon]|nr:MAG: hypothetical protein DRO61_11985 [Candidatus Bathyarchaeota archaeon]